MENYNFFRATLILTLINVNIDGWMQLLIITSYMQTYFYTYKMLDLYIQDFSRICFFLYLLFRLLFATNRYRHYIY